MRAPACRRKQVSGKLRTGAGAEETGAVKNLAWRHVDEENRRATGRGT